MTTSLYRYIADSDNFTLHDSIEICNQLQNELRCNIALITGSCPLEKAENISYRWLTKNTTIFIGKAWAPEFNLEITIATDIIDPSSLKYFLSATSYVNNTWATEMTLVDNTMCFNRLSPGSLCFSNPPIKAERSDPRGIIFPISSIRVVSDILEHPIDILDF